MPAQGLSVLARLLRQGRFEEFETGLETVRSSARPPAKTGFTRGSLGSQGVKMPGNPGTRNPNAQEDEERKMLNSPIMQAFLGRVTGV